jgi:hypothetical protein
MPRFKISELDRCTLVERDQGTAFIYLVKHPAEAFESQPIATQL